MFPCGDLCHHVPGKALGRAEGKGCWHIRKAAAFGSSVSVTPAWPCWSGGALLG